MLRTRKDLSKSYLATWHFMLADDGAMPLSVVLILAFGDIEANRPVRGFNSRKSICTKVAHLVVSAQVIYQGRQVDKSIKSGVHDAYATLDISRPIFSVTRCATRSHGSFSWKLTKMSTDMHTENLQNITSTHLQSIATSCWSVKHIMQLLLLYHLRCYLRENEYICPVCLASNKRTKDTVRIHKIGIWNQIKQMGGGVFWYFWSLVN